MHSPCRALGKHMQTTGGSLGDLRGHSLGGPKCASQAWTQKWQLNCSETRRSQQDHLLDQIVYLNGDQTHLGPERPRGECPARPGPTHTHATAAPALKSAQWKRHRLCSMQGSGETQDFKGRFDFDREWVGAAEQGPVLQNNQACASHFRNYTQKKTSQMKKERKKKKKRHTKVLGIKTLKVVFLSPIQAVTLQSENCSVCILIKNILFIPFGLI